MTPLEAIGTPAERWAAAELDVMLGRVTARELWELGREMVRAADKRIAELEEERDDAVYDMERAEERQREAEEEAEDLQGQLDELQAELDELKSTRGENQ